MTAFNRKAFNCKQKKQPDLPQWDTFLFFNATTEKYLSKVFLNQNQRERKVIFY